MQTILWRPFSWNELSLRRRWTLAGTLVALAPFPVLAAMLHYRVNVPLAPPQNAITASDLNHFADTAYRALELSQRDLSQNTLLAQRMLAADRGVKQSKSRQITWTVSDRDSVTLPLLSIHRTPLSPNARPRHAFVNQVSALSGAQCNIFQRINDSGDMLWIAASATPPAASRTVGTILPAIEADGKMNPAVQAALEKRTYTGRSLVAGDRYLSAYQPISRPDGAVIGMLSVNLPEASEAEQIRKALVGLPVGSSGEIFALSADKGASGSFLFTTSPTGPPVPPSIMGQMIRAAESQPLQTVEQQYQLASMKTMVTHLRYFAPWNWVIGVAVPQSEMAVISAPPIEPANRMAARLAIAFLLTAILAAAVWWRSSAVLADRILVPVKKIRETAEHLVATGRQIFSAEQERSRAVSECGGFLTHAAGSIADVSRAAHSALTGAGETLLAARDCEDHAVKASVELDALQAAMTDLCASNSQVSDLVKDISGIALQSRLLALNASIEAARAGQQSGAFSRVADEFGTLAQRCSEAARNTTSLLTNSVNISSTGTEHLGRLGNEIEQVRLRSQTSAESVKQLLRNSNRQAQTAADVSSAIAKSEASLARISQNADFSAAAPDKLCAEAATLRIQAKDMSSVVNGRKKTKKSICSVREPRSSASKAQEDSRSALRAY